MPSKQKKMADREHLARMLMDFGKMVPHGADSQVSISSHGKYVKSAIDGLARDLADYRNERADRDSHETIREWRRYHSDARYGWPDLGFHLDAIRKDGRLTFDRRVALIYTLLNPASDRLHLLKPVPGNGRNKTGALRFTQKELERIGKVVAGLRIALKAAREREAAVSKGLEQKVAAAELLVARRQTEGGQQIIRQGIQERNRRLQEQRGAGYVRPISSRPAGPVKDPNRARDLTVVKNQAKIRIPKIWDRVILEEP